MNSPSGSSSASSNSSHLPSNGPGSSGSSESSGFGFTSSVGTPTSSACGASPLPLVSASSFSGTPMASWFACSCSPRRWCTSSLLRTGYINMAATMDSSFMIRPARARRFSALTNLLDPIKWQDRVLKTTCPTVNPCKKIDFFPRYAYVVNPHILTHINRRVTCSTTLQPDRQ